MPGHQWQAGGACPAAAAGTLVVDLTSGVPSASREIAAALARTNIRYVDVGVSGGVAGARLASVGIGARTHEVAATHQIADLVPAGDRVVHDADRRRRMAGLDVDEEHTPLERGMAVEVRGALRATLVEHEQEAPAHVLEQRPAALEDRGFERG